MNYNYLDLFSGIAGFRLGALWAEIEFENTFHSDIDAYANKIYKLRFPDSIYLGDITKIDGKKLKEKYLGDWILSGGFPCQDISIAGKGEGIHGKRSGLWFEYWRLIRDLRPRIAVMENVGMLVHRGLREVLGSLAEIGYNAEWQDIRAEDLGAPHKRERIWIIAYPQSIRNSHDNNKKNKRKSSNRQERNEMGSNIDISSKESKSTSYSQGNDDGCSYKGGGAQVKLRNSYWREFKRNRESIIKSAICRKDDGVPYRLDRLKCLGNSIVPQIAELLFLRIKELI